MWSFVPVFGMECANETWTGIGVNPTESSSKLLIFLEAGGACFNSISCAAFAHPNGFFEEDLFEIMSEPKGVFNRVARTNPFSDYSYVFIPYCTGDIHAGVNPDGTGGRNQVGFLNVASALPEIVARFPKVEEVVLAGSSAGGFGAIANFEQVQQAFGDIPVTLLNDSGAPLPPEYMTPCFQENLAAQWGIDQIVPGECEGCRIGEGGGLYNLLPWLAEKYPDRRMGVVTSLSDLTMSTFFGFGYPECSELPIPIPGEDFAMGVAELRDDLAARYDNVAVYSVPGTKHVFFSETPMRTEVDGVRLSDWLKGMLSGSADWDNVRP